MLKGRNFFPFKEDLDQIDNANDTFCAFIDLKIRVPAIVTNSTRAICISPPSYYWHQSRVELTLNGIEYTEDENIFYYYKPPHLFDVSPRLGPLKGGNTVTVTGTNFQDTDEVRCKFGNIVTDGHYQSASEITCVVPPGIEPGWVDLKIAQKASMWSSPVKFLYYETPAIESIEPTCGPDFGYTQITVRGKNFIDLGHNKIMCVFNETIFTNATIMDNTLVYCDSPAF